MTYRYLASPYSHPEPAMMDLRYCEARDALAWLLNRQIWAYSPIVHCHDLALIHQMPTDAEFWREYNETMLRSASALLVLTIDGWSKSKGIAGEIAFAKMLGLPVQCLDPIASNYQFGRTL
jgi:hypothetical protein